MAEKNYVKVGGQLQNIVGDGILAYSKEIKDEVREKTQEQINTETYEKVAEIDEALSSLSPEQGEALALSERVGQLEKEVGYHECSTSSGTATKQVVVDGYALSSGCSIKVKMLNKNTAATNVTLKIGSSEAKPLYYAGKLVSAANTWDAGEVVDIYYNPNQDGGAYFANNVEGGSADGVFDVSDYNKSGDPLEPTKYIDLAAALGTNGNNIPENHRKGGMLIKFIELESLEYKQYRYMGTAVSGTSFTNTANWQGADSVPTEDSRNLVESGGVFEECVEAGDPVGDPVGDWVPSEAEAYVDQKVAEERARAIARENQLLKVYETFTQSNLVIGALPATGKVNTIYRVPGTNSYADYMYAASDLHTPILMATYNNDIDEIPTAGSQNLVKSGGVAREIVWDVTARNSNTTFASLSALLSDANIATLIPTTIRRGGMQIRFVLSSDNNYVQFRYMPSDAATVATFTDVANWQGVDATPTAGSKNLVESAGVAERISGTTIQTQSLTETSGKFINGEGSVLSSSGFAYTEKFYVEKGKEIIVTARGYSTSVAMISKVVTEGSAYVPLVMSLDSQVRDYKYIAESNGYYAASFSTAQPRTIKVAENTPEILSSIAFNNKNNIDNVSNNLGYIDLYQGGVSSSNGKKNTSSIFVRTPNIYTKGCTIDVNDDYYIYGAYWYDENGNFVSAQEYSQKKSFTDDRIGTNGIVSFILSFIKTTPSTDIYPTDLVLKTIPEQTRTAIKPSDVVDNTNSDSVRNPLSANQGRLLNIKIGAITDVELPAVTEVSGKFIGASGSVTNNADFAYSSPFYAKKGEAITFVARGYLTYVAMISKVVTENSVYTPVVLSDSSEVKKYVYIADSDGYYAVSYNLNYEHSLAVSTSNLKEIASIVEDLSEEVNSCAEITQGLVEKTEGANITTVSPTEIQNKFIANYGTVASSNGFAYTEPFFAKSGQKITVKAKGYSTYVAMISKVVTEDVSYTPLVISIDGNVRDYEYIVEEDGYYAASYDYFKQHTIKITENTPELLDDRIKENTEDIERIESLIPTNPNLSQGLYKGVPIVGMIGDSLMSGAGYNPNTSIPSDNINYAWWKVLERESGMTYKRFCQGGMSTFRFVDTSDSAYNTYGLGAALNNDNKCNLYIIGLEVNDRNNYASSLGTTSDIDLSDADNNANTFYGNYAKIIQKITSFNPVAKFILFTNPRTDGNWNDAIRYIAELFDNCYLVDLWDLYSTYFTQGGYYYSLMDSSAHYPAMAYASMANILAQAIDDCISENMADFKNIQYSLG